VSASALFDTVCTGNSQDAIGVSRLI